MIRLREWMAETGTSQADLAKSLGISQPSVSEWVNGNSFPSIENLRQLSRLTEISVDDLLFIPTDAERPTAKSMAS